MTFSNYSTNLFTRISREIKSDTLKFLVHVGFPGGFSVFFFGGGGD